MIELMQINPLNLFDLRIVEHCPPHFFAVDFDCKVQVKRISDWIYEHLHGRYYLGDALLIKQGRQTICKRAAFEIHSEASYFAMVLPELNQSSLVF